MPIQNLEYPKFRALDNNGNPLSAGKVEIFLAGTSTQAITYTDAVRTAQNTNPVILDSAGEAEIWFDVTVDVEIRDSSDVLQDKILGLAANLTPTVTGNLNLLSNGSFEADDDSDNIPDNWTVAPEASATIQIDSTAQAHGHNSLKFDGGGSGGGTATSTRFDIAGGSELAVQFTYKSSQPTTTNGVQLRWFDKNGNIISPSTTVHSDSSTNPSTFTTYDYVVTSPGNAVQADIVLTGVSGGGSDLAEDTWFDNVQVIASSPVVTLKGTQTLTNKTLDSATIESPTITDPSFTNYGTYILDEPEVLVNASSATTWQSVTSSTLSTNGAKVALLRVKMDVSNSSGSATNGSLYIQKSLLTAIADDRTEVLSISHSESGASFVQAFGDNFVAVNLSSTYYFNWLASIGTGTAISTTIVLWGYRK